MAEKKEGFGAAPQEQQQRRPAPILFNDTPDYEVTIGMLPPDKDTHPENPLLVRYITRHKVHKVIYGTFSSVGLAIAAALEAQAILQNAVRIAEQQKDRNYEADGATSPAKGLDIPRFN